MKIGESMGVLHSFTCNYVKYAKMEGIRRDSHIFKVLTKLCRHISQLRKVYQFHKADKGSHYGS